MVTFWAAQQRPTTAHAASGSFVQITNFGTNPTSLQMYLYTPPNVKPHPAILLAMHQCTGSGPGFESSTQFANLADQYGFLVIFPSVTRSGQCWDVYSNQGLARNGGSDNTGLISMITYVEQHDNGDSTNVYATGASSGAMMTNVMLAEYPDVFKAGSAFMGVPYDCFATGATTATSGSNWNSTCADGQVSMTAQQWGTLVRNADTGYSGSRPRMQLWHGTADPTLNYNNFGQEILQWTNVLGVSQTPSSTDTPQSGWTRTRYGGTGTESPVEGVSIAGAGHVLPEAGTGMEADAVAFMGLNNVSSSTPTPTPTTGTTPTPTPTPITNGSGYAVNAGGPATGSFAADELFSGGSTNSTTNTIDTSAVTNPAPQAVYQTERYGNFTYTFPNLSPGATYTVRLHEAEFFWTSTGQRVFNVSINGQQVLTNFDIIAAAGGADRAIVEQFTTTATSSGQIAIQFTTVTDNAKISGIEILPGNSGVTPTPTPTQPPLTPTPTQSVPTPTPTQSVPTPTPSPTSGTTGSSCSIQYVVSNQWSTGFSATINITNTGSTPINGWTLQFSFANSQVIQPSPWNGTFTQSGSAVTVSNLSYNGSIAAGGGTLSSAPGFNGSWSGTNAAPTAFALNGVACSVS